MLIYFGVMFFLFGVCFGSFVNMLIFRVAIKYGLTKMKRANTSIRPYYNSRSYCDYCGRQLTWKENIPILSWVIQKGKTTCCHKKLSPLYPVIELGLGILFLLNFLFYKEINIILLSTTLVLVFLWFSMFFDFKYYILPDFSTVVLIILALIINYKNLVTNILAGFVIFIFFWCLSKIKIRGQEAMGGGDVKLVFFIGLFLGFGKMLVAIYLSFIIGSIVSVLLILFKIIDRKSPVPFGPFLIIGTMVSWYFGEQILHLFI